MRISDWSSDVCSSDLTHADAIQGVRLVRLVFIHGAAASGKLTVARELAALTGLPLFHNHLVVDALLAVFPFGSPGFVLLRETMWMDVFRAAAAEGRSLIFTFHPEASVAPDFPGRVVTLVEAAGGPEIGSASCRERVCQYV